MTQRAIYKLRQATISVKRAETMLARARDRRDAAVIAAAAAGHSTTTIATAAELSGQTVRVLVRHGASDSQVTA